eukprot:7390272-Prymnesium_polylepis.1
MACMALAQWHQGGSLETLRVTQMCQQEMAGDTHGSCWPPITVAQECRDPPQSPPVVCRSVRAPLRCGIE